MIPGPLTLLCKYEIALEAHPQNTCLVIEDGVPLASLAHDFAGIRVNPKRLSTSDYTVDTYPESMIVTSDADALYNKLYYALFQNQLTELIVGLTRNPEFDEATCWECIRAQCQDVFSSLRTDEAVPEDRIDQDEAALHRMTMIRLHSN